MSGCFSFAAWYCCMIGDRVPEDAGAVFTAAGGGADASILFRRFFFSGGRDGSDSDCRLGAYVTIGASEGGAGSGPRIWNAIRRTYDLRRANGSFPSMKISTRTSHALATVSFPYSRSEEHTSELQ